MIDDLPSRPIRPREGVSLFRDPEVEAVDFVCSSSGVAAAFAIIKPNGRIHGWFFSSPEDCWVRVIESTDFEEVAEKLHDEIDEDPEHEYPISEESS